MSNNFFYTGDGGGGGKPDQIIDISAGGFNYPTADVAPLNTDILTNGQVPEQWADDTTITKVLAGNRRLDSDVDEAGTVTFEVAVKAETAPGVAKTVVHELLHSHCEDTDDIDVAYTTESSGGKTIGTQADGVYIHTWTETMANLGWKQNGFLRMILQRNPAAPDDLVDRLGYLHLRVRIPRA